MAEITNRIDAETRATFGKGAARKLRVAGRTPAVIYGHGTEPRHVSLPGHQLMLLLRRANQVLEVIVDGKEQLALVKDVQRDPVRQIIEHVDLLVVRRGEKVHVDIPILIEGESAPSTIVLQEAPHVTIDVDATRIPEHFAVSVEGLEAGAHVAAGDVELPEGATLVSDPELVLIVVSARAAAAEVETEAVADEAEAPAEEAPAEDAAE